MPPIPLSTHGARAGVDPLLTTTAYGYKDTSFIGKFLAPAVASEHYGGTVIQFDDASFDYQDDQRAPGSVFKTIYRGYEGKPFKITYHGLDFNLPVETLEQAKKVAADYADIAPKELMQRAALSHEVSVMQLATNPNNYNEENRVLVTGGDYWDAVDPYDQILDAIDVISNKIGTDENLCLFIGKEVYKRIILNPEVISKYTYAPTDLAKAALPKITVEMLRARYDLRHIFVGKGSWRETTMSPNRRIWGNYAVLAYVNPKVLDAIDRSAQTGSVLSGLKPMPGVSYAPSSLIDNAEPAFAYTYTYTGSPDGSHPLVMSPRYVDDNNSIFWRIKYDREPVIAMQDGGYLWVNPIDPAVFQGN